MGDVYMNKKSWQI